MSARSLTMLPMHVIPRDKCDYQPSYT